MSGRSKWSTIKRKKAATDAKRGRIFTRLLKEIQVAARMGGGDPAGNPRLKTAVLTAKSQSVPGDNIDKAIKRGSGDMEGVQYEEVTYEGYGAGGAAILVKALTDNKTRTVAEVRHAFSRGNGNLGSSNSVGYLFKEKGIITIEHAGLSEDKVFEVALDAGASDISDDGSCWEISTEPRDFESVKAALDAAGFKSEAELRMVAETSVRITGRDAENMLRLMDMLDDIDDVQNVTSNFDIDEQELEALNQGK